MCVLVGICLGAWIFGRDTEPETPPLKKVLVVLANNDKFEFPWPYGSWVDHEGTGIIIRRHMYNSTATVAGFGSYDSYQIESRPA